MGRLQLPIAWDHYLYAWITRVSSLSATTGNTHAPGPSGMPTSGHWYLPLWPLCMVCARKGVNNLLNHTPPVAGTSGSTNQVWGLPEQDSIYGRLRRPKFPAVVSTIKCSFNSSTKTGLQPLHVPTCITNKAWSCSDVITLLPVTVFLLYLLLQVSHDKNKLHGTRKHADTICMQIFFEFNTCMIQLFLQTFNHAITISSVQDACMVKCLQE